MSIFGWAKGCSIYISFSIFLFSFCCCCALVLMYMCPIFSGAYSNATNAAVFQMLNISGVRNHFHKPLSSTECIVEQCEMIPLEIVSRRLVTGMIRLLP